MTPSANTITSELLINIPKRFPSCRVWRSNRIEAMAVGRGGRLRRVSAGVDGQGDISGIGPQGKRIEVEVKAGRDKQSEKQIAFQEMILSHGGIYIVARDVEVALHDLGAELGTYAAST